uniref:Uncharacterized protein n=1 Tax=Parascaris univalens TaxID=6257 RepID=A0A915B179_PARUN
LRDDTLSLYGLFVLQHTNPAVGNKSEVLILLFYASLCRNRQAEIVFKVMRVGCRLYTLCGKKRFQATHLLN